MQQAVAAAQSGDRVSLAPGVYREKVVIPSDKTIVVDSTSGPEDTAIAGDFFGPVVTVMGSSTIRGITVLNGTEGIVLASGAPRVTGVVVRNNGVGIRDNATGSWVIDSRVYANEMGIRIDGRGGGIVARNEIFNNEVGIRFFFGGSPMIRENIIRDNEESGIHVANVSSPAIFNNLIVGNAAAGGAGIECSVGGGVGLPRIASNTIADNLGPGVFLDGSDAGVEMFNNIVVAGDGADAILCDGLNALSRPRLSFNLVYKRSGSAYAGDCDDQTGVSGNLTGDPRWVDRLGRDFHLKADSPAIDAGRDTGALTADIDGDRRPAPGRIGAEARIDLGFDEYVLPLGPQTPTFTPTPGADMSPTRRPTLTRTPSRVEVCHGDCNRDGRVTIADLISAVRVLLGLLDISVCPSADARGDGGVDVSELTQAVRASLAGCLYPTAPTPTPIPTTERRQHVLLDIPSNDLLYDRERELLYASIQRTFVVSEMLGIAVISPHDAEQIDLIDTGGEAGPLAISHDGQFIYTAVDSRRSIVRIDLDRRVVDESFSSTADGFLEIVGDIAVAPNHPDRLAIVLLASNLASDIARGVAFDGGVALPGIVPRPGDRLAFGPDGSTLYGIESRDSRPELTRMSVDALGLTVLSRDFDVLPDHPGDMRYEGGLMYLADGEVIDPSSRDVIEPFATEGYSVAPRAAASRVSYLRPSGAELMITTYAPTGIETIHLPVSPYPIAPNTLVWWGSDGFAFRQDRSVIVVGEGSRIQ